MIRNKINNIYLVELVIVILFVLLNTPHSYAEYPENLRGYECWADATWRMDCGEAYFTEKNYEYAYILGRPRRMRITKIHYSYIAVGKNSNILGSIDQDIESGFSTRIQKNMYEYKAIQWRKDEVYQHNRGVEDPDLSFDNNWYVKDASIIKKCEQWKFETIKGWHQKSEIKSIQDRIDHKEFEKRKMIQTIKNILLFLPVIIIFLLLALAKRNE